MGVGISIIRGLWNYGPFSRAMVVATAAALAMALCASLFAFVVAGESVAASHVSLAVNCFGGAVLLSAAALAFFLAAWGTGELRDT